MALDHFDPAANDTRYSLDYAAYLVCRENPSSVHVAGSRTAVAEAVVRRLPRRVAVTVPTDEMAAALTDRLGRPVDAGTGEGAAAVVVPFAIGETSDLPAAPLTVVAEYNARSYKGLLAPGRLRVTASDVERWLRARGTITERIGVMGPDFIALWELARLAGPRRPDWHFRLTDLAMQRIFSTGSLWRYGYVVVLAGRRG